MEENLKKKKLNRASRASETVSEVGGRHKYTISRNMAHPRQDY